MIYNTFKSLGLVMFLSVLKSLMVTKAVFYFSSMFLILVIYIITILKWLFSVLIYFKM